MSNERTGVSWQADWEQESSTLPLLEYVQLLWFRRKLIAVITLFVALIGFIQVNEIKNVYSATSALQVGLPESRVVDIEAVVSRDYRSSDDATSEVEVIMSRGLVAKVIERLGLLNNPEFNPALAEPETSLFDFLQYLDPRGWIPVSWKRAIKEALGQETEWTPPPTAEEREAEQQQRLLSQATNIFLSKLKVEQVEWTNVLKITFSSLDPKTAAKVANELPEAYILDQLESKFDATEKANSWLTEQLAELKAKVAESERAVEIYRNEHGLAEGAGVSILDAEMSELNSQLIVARAELAEIEARLEQLQRLVASGGPGVQTAAEVSSSALVQQLRAQEAAALSRASELSVEFGPRHPRMLQVQAEIAEIRERIRTEVEGIVTALESEAEFARTRVASLAGNLDRAREQGGEQNKEEVQLRALEREAAANRTLFETFLNRFKETSTTQGLESSNARVLSYAEPPAGPSYPNRRAMVLNYALVGLLGGCGLVMLLHLLNPGLTSPEQVQSVLAEHVVGVIPLVASAEPHEYALEHPGSALVEAVNSLRFSLTLSDPDTEIKIVQVTSSVPEEGKTSLAICLARVLAASGRRVLLIDGDLRRSSIGRKLGLDRKHEHKGISDLMVAGDADIADFVLHDEKGGVDYMPPGTAQYANASDIFASHRMSQVVAELKKRYDMVVIDAPPVMAVADARIIGQAADKTLFVLRWNKTPRKVARAALQELRHARVNLAGVVLQQVNMDRYSRIGYGSSGYYFPYGRYGKYYSG